MKKYLVPLVLLLILITSALLKEKSPRQFSQGQNHKNRSPTVTAAPPKNQPARSLLSLERQKAQVTRVIDGDTVELEGGARVRYIGIDTPETVDPRKSVQCFGQEAAAKNRELVEGKIVELEKDISETDKYGRLLGYVYVDGIFVNDYLVRQGFAFASSYPPDIKYQDKFQQAEREARENQRGLWLACGEKAETLNACQIKGNISSSGEKIYHRPDCPYWSRTVISEEKGERWFCSEEEAQKASWRMAQNCP